MNKRYRSINRAFKRGHLSVVANSVTGRPDVYRRTTNRSKPWFPYFF